LTGTIRGWWHFRQTTSRQPSSFGGGGGKSASTFGRFLNKHTYRSKVGSAAMLTLLLGSSGAMLQS
jgi:hypothetical protein